MLPFSFEIERQNINEPIVNKHVIEDRTMEVCDLFELEILDYCDDIENLYIDSSKYEEYGFESEEEFRDSGEDQKEIYQWYIVSDWLAGKLRERGETMLEHDGHQLWGRGAFGQAIILDGVIGNITRKGDKTAPLSLP